MRIAVTNRAGEQVGTLCKTTFLKWQREQKNKLGGRIAIVIQGTKEILIDTGAAMRKIPAGSYDAILVQRSAIPSHVRNELRDCDLWRVV